jgi:hypothetical protein
VRDDERAAEVARPRRAAGSAPHGRHGLAVADGQFPTLRPEYRRGVREFEPNRPSTSRTSRPRDRPKPRSLSGLRLSVVFCPSATGCPGPARRRPRRLRPGEPHRAPRPAAIGAGARPRSRGCSTGSGRRSGYLTGCGRCSRMPTNSGEPLSIIPG